jgi:lipoprotein-releasing system ATP-binding protein
MNQPIVLEAKKIVKRFTTPSLIEVLKGIDLTLHAEEAIAIMGKSGEGKSTLLHILGSLDTPCSGELFILGESIRSASLPQLRNKHIGFIFQSCHLLEDYTALENVLMPARIARKSTYPGSEAHARALMLLEMVKLKERVQHPAKLLSGGEKQRVAIARALMSDPALILADEPSGNLDYAHSQEIHQLLLHLVKTFHKSLIVVTHDKELASLCDRILFLKEGHLECIHRRLLNNSSAECSN